jgi:hypothetical protein
LAARAWLYLLIALLPGVHAYNNACRGARLLAVRKSKGKPLQEVAHRWHSIEEGGEYPQGIHCDQAASSFSVGDHGGFYKHFGSKDDLLLESLREGFRQIEDTLAHAAEHSQPGEARKAIVKTYLSLELCEHPERGCPPGGTFTGSGAGR